MKNSTLYHTKDGVVFPDFSGKWWLIKFNYPHPPWKWTNVTWKGTISKASWQFFGTFLGWLSDLTVTFSRIKWPPTRNKTVNLNHVEFVVNIPMNWSMTIPIVFMGCILHWPSTNICWFLFALWVGVLRCQKKRQKECILLGKRTWNPKRAGS